VNVELGGGHRELLIHRAGLKKTGGTEGPIVLGPGRSTAAFTEGPRKPVRNTGADPFSGGLIHKPGGRGEMDGPRWRGGAYHLYYKKGPELGRAGDADDMEAGFRKKLPRARPKKGLAEEKRKKKNRGGGNQGSSKLGPRGTGEVAPGPQNFRMGKKRTGQEHFRRIGPAGPRERGPSKLGGRAGERGGRSWNGGGGLHGQAGPTRAFQKKMRKQGLFDGLKGAGVFLFVRLRGKAPRIAADQI